MDICSEAYPSERTGTYGHLYRSVQAELTGHMETCQTEQTIIWTF